MGLAIVVLLHEPSRTAGMDGIASTDIAVRCGGCGSWWSLP
jgi:hypothetical protein